MCSFTIWPCAVASSNYKIYINICYIKGLDDIEGFLDDFGEAEWAYYIGISTDGGNRYTWQDSSNIYIPQDKNEVYVYGNHTFSGINSGTVRIAIVLYDNDDYTGLWADNADISSNPNKGYKRPALMDWGVDPRSNDPNWRDHGAFVGTYSLSSNSFIGGDRVDSDNSDSYIGQCYLTNGEWDGSYSTDEKDALIKFKVSDNYNEPPTVGDDYNKPPTALFDYSYSSLSHVATFTDRSNDPDGYIESYYWNFGDGGTSIEQSPTHTFTSSGTYTVTLTVTDNGGKTDQYSCNPLTININKPLIIKPFPPFTYTPQNPTTDDIIQFTDLCTGTIKWLWDFGDGSTSNECNPTHRYEHSGHYSISFHYDFSDGSVSACASGIYVREPVSNNIPTASPIADFKYTIWENREVQFTDSSSVPNTHILVWRWDFGDGTWVEFLNPMDYPSDSQYLDNIYVSDGKTPTHNYSSDGIYAVDLWIVDNAGLSDNITKIITINAQQSFDENEHDYNSEPWLRSQNTTRENNNVGKNDTPGFEAILLFLSIISIVIIYRKKKTK